ncbi:hypothetical protein [Chitinophaga qingshengii]|uniref:Uncharacterized protein n=1 Tax=Chitinophaga qingshengii TaxID=1569794 RepID=A0ABR7TI97_9BACT|nr:hypothetical protein [Chitinophaga qingshengii]MBC9929114.1 hypothetical protein [Chitinophaga qingshengii]
MTVYDLIGLVGRKSTDPAISQLFATCGLSKPPKTLNANQGDKSYQDKQNNLGYRFKFDITHDQFYPPVSPKKDEYTFECFLSSVVLYSTDRKKTPDPKPAAFWEGFIHPGSSYEECLAFFQASHDPKCAIFRKQVSEVAQLIVWLEDDQSRITAMEVRIPEKREIFSRYDFKETNQYNTIKQAYTLLVKWLFDHHYFLLPEDVYREPLTTDHAAILGFTERYLKNHIWDTQLTDDKNLVSFLFRIARSGSITLASGEKINSYIKILYIDAAGKGAERQELYDNATMNEVDELERSLWLNETQCQAFLQKLSDLFELFKQAPKEVF